MPDNPSSNDATQMAGELFGNLFGRDSHRADRKRIRPACAAASAWSKRPEPVRVKEFTIRILEDDWQKIVAELVDSPEYKAIHGDYGVPLWI